MRRRGFVKFAAGTNRVVYRPVESDTFVIKVAYDAIGLGDNPKEFRNQISQMEEDDKLEVENPEDLKELQKLEKLDEMDKKNK